MKDLFDLFGTILSVLKIPQTAWTVALFFALILLRNPLKKLGNNFLGWLAVKYGSEFGYRHFAPQYRKYIRDLHLHLKIVGIRTEEERPPKITDAYIPIKLLPKGGSIDHAVTVEQVIGNSAYNLILGDPGAGKSTILDHLTVEFTQLSIKGKSSHLISSKEKSGYPCPVYIPLRRCQQKNETLLDDILDPTTGILPHAVRQKMPKNFIRYCFEHGRTLLLLDGLDEVASESDYYCVARKVNDFIQFYPNNKVVVTCRKAGWRGYLHPDFQMFLALPLDSQQQHDFVHKWYAAISQYTFHDIGISESDLLRRAEREANRLLALVRVRDRLSELASNP